MKKLIKKTGSAFVLTAFFANSAFAQMQDLLREDPGQIGGTAKGSLGQNITTIINYFLGLLGLIAVAMLIYAGVLMVTAGGNDEQVTKARKIIMYAVVGIVIILLSYTVVTFVASALG
ncbi:pilin [Patescibacteria group bacterium]|nr:pilin [Patescibacteria group bacterium]